MYKHILHYLSRFHFIIRLDDNGRSSSGGGEDVNSTEPAGFTINDSSTTDDSSGQPGGSGGDSHARRGQSAYTTALYRRGDDRRLHFRCGNARPRRCARDTFNLGYFGTHIDEFHTYTDPRHWGNQEVLQEFEAPPERELDWTPNQPCSVNDWKNLLFLGYLTFDCLNLF